MTKAIRNTVKVRDLCDSYRSETRFTNISGNYQYRGDFSVSRQSQSRRYQFTVDSTISYLDDLSLDDGLLKHAWRTGFLQRVSARVHPWNWIEVSP